MRGVLQRIRQQIKDRDYYLSSHAEEEMYADWLDRPDVEHAIIRGRIHKKLTEDPRGSRFRIAGPARNGRPMHVVCRFDGDHVLRIITVYALGDPL